MLRKIWVGIPGFLNDSQWFRSSGLLGALWRHNLMMCPHPNPLLVGEGEREEVGKTFQSERETPPGLP